MFNNRNVAGWFDKAETGAIPLKCKITKNGLNMQADEAKCDKKL